MVYAFESDTKIDDDILKQELGTNSDVQLKNIVRTIQKEQNAIIRNTQDRILAIQGQPEAARLPLHYTGSHTCCITTENI